MWPSSTPLAVTTNKRVADDQRRADGQIVREDVQFADHVQLPEDLFLAARAGGIGADDLGAIVDVVEPIALDDRAGADAFVAANR